MHSHLKVQCVPPGGAARGTRRARRTRHRRTARARAGSRRCLRPHAHIVPHAAGCMLHVARCMLHAARKRGLEVPCSAATLRRMRWLVCLFASVPTPHLGASLPHSPVETRYAASSRPSNRYLAVAPSCHVRAKLSPAAHARAAWEVPCVRASVRVCVCVMRVFAGGAGGGRGGVGGGGGGAL